jgi:DNA-binding NtrC family response regulator
MNANILIIDDEESIRFSFHRFLSAKGHSVFTADSYLEALLKMDEVNFDLILADIILNDRCGLDILKEVMLRNLKTRVIIMTAYPTSETIEASFRMEAIDYLTKPLRQEELLYFVSKALQQMGKGDIEGSSSVGKTYLIPCDESTVHSHRHSSSVNVNAPDQAGTHDVSAVDDISRS